MATKHRPQPAPRTTERPFVTPEGVDLRLNIADASQRAAAFIIDAIIIVLIMIALFFALAFTGGLLFRMTGKFGGEIALSVGLLIFFLLRNFYFTLFEMTPAAATPGKRMVGLRVAARDGGQLRAQAVFTRNIMRELEVFVPLSMMMQSASSGGVSGWIYLLGFVWSFIFVFFPLFNKDRLRLGDLVGGTWVVRTPKLSLGRDMADDGSSQIARFGFSPAQLDAYGAKEVQVLEGVLRARNRQTQAMVAERIMKKIGWIPHPAQNDAEFLSAYYAAVRGHLEKKLLMGVRRRDKHDV